MAYTKDIGLKDFYKFYKEYGKKKDKICESYQTFSKIIKSFNLKLKNKLLYDSEKVTLPYKLGELSIRKFERKFKEGEEYKWKVDFKKTKELGRVVYHEDRYGYRFYWNKKTCKINGRRYYYFKPCRTASRDIAKAVKTKNIDYFY